MTDKEELSEEEYKLAEEVIKPIYYKATKNDYSFAKYGVECFLAGLKAGKDMNVATKWHDLRKDPKDLPPAHRIVLNQVGMATQYDPKKGFLGFGGAGIIAWCEIPTYNEE